jgi:hypothetical protein
VAARGILDAMRLAILAALLALAAPTAAQEIPFDLNGITLGTDLASIEASGRFSCVDPKSPVADRLCRLKSGEKETIAEAPVKGLFLYFYSGKLEMISLTLDPKAFPEVVSALSKRYGTGNMETEAMQNVTGKSFENRIYTWRRANAGSPDLRPEPRHVDGDVP